MASSTTYAPGSLEVDCPGGLAWAWYGLGECIRTPRDKVSVAFGVLSIVAWFMFGFPQMITNCIKKIPDEAVSPWLLVFWLAGDSLNFVGTFLTNQLFLQKVLAGYTVLVDLLLIGQYIYYYCLHKHKVKKYGEEYNVKKDDENSFQSRISKMPPSSTPTKTLATVLLGVIGVSYLFMPGMLSEPGNPTHLGTGHLQGRQLLQAAPVNSITTTPNPFADFLVTKEEKIGYAIGWVGAVMYFCSRVPQIVQNFKRKSTEGLSLYLFLLAIFGNVFYGLQIFIKSTDPAFIVNSLPWILGSLGILVFDFIIMGQFIAYRNNKADATLVEEGDEIGSNDEKDYIF
uniref:Lysosomal amino acid transporter 1 homolog n=2 Tax=Schistocephalus solidus TaxID=70667 RepID=A0A0X3P7Y8_SCHSO